MRRNFRQPPLSHSSSARRAAICLLVLANACLLVLAAISLLILPSYAQHSSRRYAAAAPSAGGAPYPQFRDPQWGVIHWVKDQMPLKVYVSHGVSLDGFIDQQTGAPLTNVSNKEHWPDLVGGVMEKPEELANLPPAGGYSEDQYQAAVAGINSWHAYQNAGFSFEVIDDPAQDADIYVFWTNHFVNAQGLGLFENDIRGYTAKRSFPYKAILEGKRARFMPVVTLLRTTKSNGVPMSYTDMKASAAHEFGHALGIEGHSKNSADLMSVYYGRGVISNNDAATIRYLYRLTPDLIP